VTHASRLLRVVVPLVAVLGFVGALAPSASALGNTVVIDGFGSSTAAASPFTRAVTALPLPNTSTTPAGTFSASNGLATMTMSGAGNGTAGTQLDYTPKTGTSVDMTGAGNNTQILISLALVDQVPFPGQPVDGVTVELTATDTNGGEATAPSDGIGNYFAFNAAFPFTDFKCDNNACNTTDGGQLDFAHINHLTISFVYPASGTGGGSLTVEVNELWATPTGGAPPSFPSPTVTAPDPAVAAHGGTVNFTVAFSDDQGAAPVTYMPPSDTGLRGQDLTVGGTAFGGGTPTVNVTGGPSTYTVAVGGMTQAGTIQVDVPAAVVEDAWGQSNAASSGDPVANFTFAVPPTFVPSGGASFTELTNGSFTVQTTGGNPTPALSIQQGNLPTGLTFTDNGDGTATISGAPDLNTTGTYPLTLKATNLAGTVTQDLTLTVNRASQAALALTSTSGTYGTGLTLTTSGGSGTGAVSYAVDSGGTASGCSITAGVLSVTSTGTCLVTATQAGDGNYNPVSSPQTTVTFAPADQAPLIVTSTSGTFGSDLTLTTSGGSGTGAVSYALDSGGTASDCTLNAGSLSVSSTGTCVVTAMKAGDGNYNSASSPQTTVTFASAAQAPLSVTSTSGTYGSGLTLTTSGGSGTGDVSYAVTDGTASGCSITAGVLSVSSAGTCLVTATKAGDANYNPVSSPQTTVTFAPADQAPLTVTSTSGTFGSGLKLTTSGGSGTGDVSYVVVDGTASGCSITAGVLSVSGAGTCLVTATKAADVNYNPASSPQTTVTVAKAPQSITFTSQPPAQPQVGGGYTVAATAGSGLPVVFSIDPSSGTGVCSIAGAAVSFTGAGACVIDADQAGNGNYLASKTSQQTVTVTAPSVTQQTGPGPVVSVLPPNHFVEPPRYTARRNGSFFISVRVPGPGRIDVMITAWKGNLIHGALDAHLFKLLQPAPGRFVFARARANASAGGVVKILVNPNTEGRLLVARNRPETLVRIWVTFTPPNGRSHSVGYYGVLLG
jgi:Putative Ig domain